MLNICKILVLISMILFYGCATGGKTRYLRFESDVDGVLVTIGDSSCITPCTLNIKAASNITMTAEKDGYETLSNTINGKADMSHIGGGGGGGSGGAFLVYLLLMSSVITTFHATGSMYYFDDIYFIQMAQGNMRAEKNGLKKYVFITYDNLKSDAAKGDGEYLEHLFKTFFVWDTDEKKIITEIIINSVDRIDLYNNLEREIPKRLFLRAPQERLFRETP